ncbi:MarR family winged helix-turn-helix transcriptional regulator [Streptomyces sp. URMC 127]|uniref:MarR family winged helix-turn-helix transcriptional regulator n=1 Tax=Streptomyces sp. URMC 127 TaxID=3423402 RepID=UPI003F1A6961
MTAHDTHAATAERAWGQLREIVLGGNERRKEVVDALGMSFFRIKALRRIARGPLTLRELAEMLLTDRPYTTLVVDDLEARGLVERTANPADRRSKIVSATAAGREAAARAERILGTPPPALLSLPPEDLAELERITAKLAAYGP